LHISAAGELADGVARTIGKYGIEQLRLFDFGQLSNIVENDSLLTESEDSLMELILNLGDDIHRFLKSSTSSF
jgi:hypothetical protein